MADPPPPNLRGPILLSVAAALVTIGMKSTAYLLTGSAGLLADALESGVNLLAAVTAYLSLRYSARPADPTHAWGHEKIEFFSSGLEGALVIVAGLGTAAYAARRLVAPEPLAQLDLGGAIALAASGINLAVGQYLLRVGRRHGSPVLEADGHHLMTDVWTSVAVVFGLALVGLTGVVQLDAGLALLVGLHICGTGLRLVRRAFDGLMDHALPADEQAALRAAIRAALPPGADFHMLRTRRAGRRKFADFHVLVDGNLPLRDAHAVVDAVERQLRATVPAIEVSTHLEPIDEPSSWEAARLAELGEPTQPKGFTAEGAEKTNELSPQRAQRATERDDRQ